MNSAETAYWRKTIQMCEADAKPRRKYWRDLKQRLAVKEGSFLVRGVKHPVYISRFYKIVREIIASVAFRDPFLFLKAEEDPADPDTGESLQDATTILQDFVNDTIEAMRCKQKVRQVIFDALFCYRGWMKFGFRKGDGGVAPYQGSDVMIDDFTFVRRVEPENMLTDPLTPPEEFFDGEYAIERMYVSAKNVMRDTRFENFWSRLKDSVEKSEGTDFLMPAEDDEEKPEAEVERQTLAEAHRLRKVRRMYEIHDRVGRRRITFIDGIEEPIEEREHPFLDEVLVSTPDPATGRALLSRPTDAATGSANISRRKKFLIEGGMPYFSLAFDTSDKFYGEPIMAYENPIQNAIIKSVSRRMEVLDKFKSLAKIKDEEVEANPSIVDQLKNAETGDVLRMRDPKALEPVEWGGIDDDQVRIERDMLQYERETIRTAPDTGTGVATEAALSASVAEVNRELSQEPVEELYLWIARNAMSVMSADQFQPANHLLRTTSQHGMERTSMALQSWHLRGRFNINIAAGSMNVLYEQMHTDKTLSLVNFLRGSPNVDSVELDKYVIRAHGEIDPAKLLKDEAAIDAAKAAELENQMMVAFQHDPGVTPGEDHDTHINLQNQAAIQGHPQFTQLPPEVQQLVLRIAAQHVELHKQAQLDEAQRFNVPLGPSRKAKPETLLGQVQSQAQETQDVVSKEAEDVMNR